MANGRNVSLDVRTGWPNLNRRWCSQVVLPKPADEACYSIREVRYGRI